MKTSGAETPFIGSDKPAHLTEQVADDFKKRLAEARARGENITFGLPIGELPERTLDVTNGVPETPRTIGCSDQDWHSETIAATLAIADPMPGQG